MRNIKKLVARGLIIGVVIGLFAADITVCSKIGTSMKEKRIEQAKERHVDTLIGFGENVITPAIEKDKADKQAELQKELLDDAISHKSDKPVQAKKPLTEQEKKDINLG
jgi:hypothetical protein